MKKHYFFLLFLSTLINIIISSSLQAKNSHRLISLASGQIIHKYKSNLDTLVTKKVDTDEIKIQPNKIGRLQSALDTADEEIVVSNKIIDTSKRSIDSIQKVEIKKIKKYSNIVNASTVLAVAISIPSIKKANNQAVNDYDDSGYFFAAIVLGLVVLIGYSLVKLNSAKAKLKKGWITQLDKKWKFNYRVASVLLKIYSIIGIAYSAWLYLVSILSYILLVWYIIYKLT